MENLSLEYGMRLSMTVHPLEFCLGFSYTSSMSKKESAEYTLDRYWKDDSDPNQYKVRLIPDNPHKYPSESFYSTDLKSLIRDGQIKIIQPLTTN